MTDGWTDGQGDYYRALTQRCGALKILKVCERHLTYFWHKVIVVISETINTYIIIINTFETSP